MPYATRLLLLVTSLPALSDELRDRIQQLLAERGNELEETILSFVLKEISPSRIHVFEQRLAEEMRELGRRLMELTLNLLDPEDPEGVPHDVTYATGGYRRLNRKTRNAHVGTLFGTIELWRRGYRYWHRAEGEKTVFPLELQLGLVRGATPALAGAASRYMAEAGATQAAVLSRLRQQHNVAWGAERLRAVVQLVGQAMEGLLREHQVFKILELLEKAAASRGTRKPVLSVGRDGISLCEYKHRCYEVATTGTVTVYDRAGNRGLLGVSAGTRSAGDERPTHRVDPSSPPSLARLAAAIGLRNGCGRQRNQLLPSSFAKNAASPNGPAAGVDSDRRLLSRLRTHLDDRPRTVRWRPTEGSLMGTANVPFAKEAQRAKPCPPFRGSAPRSP